MTRHVHTDAADLSALSGEWADLLADSAASDVFLSPDWVRTWWDVFGPTRGRRLCTLSVRDGGRLVGLVPLSRRAHWYPPGLPFRRLEMLCSGEFESEAICCDYLSPIARRGHEAAVAASFLAALEARECGGWDELEIPLMDAGADMTTLLADGARKRGWAVSVEETTRAPYVALPATWDAYLASLGKKERYLVKRTLKDYEAWAGEPRIVSTASGATVAEGLAVLHQLHGERWEGGDGGTFRAARFNDFHERALAIMAPANNAELFWLMAHDRPVAVMYTLVWGGKVSFYQCGRAMDVPDGVRPGGALLYLAIRRAIESGRREFDFLGGDAVYKRQLATASRPLATFRVCRPTWVETARLATARAKELLRPVWHGLRRKSLSPRPIPPAVVDDTKAGNPGAKRI